MNDGTTHSARTAALEHLEEIEQDCVRRFVSLLAARLGENLVEVRLLDELVNATYPLYLECGRQIGPQWRTLDQRHNPQTDPEREFKRNVEAELFRTG